MSNNLTDVEVDIILPNYNSAEYLEKTIDSIINQTFKNWSLTIVDANSNEETKQIRTAWPVGAQEASQNQGWVWDVFWHLK